MNIRSKDSTLVRRDALEAAVRKSRQGCASCAQSYLNLARDRGATSEDLASTAELIASASLAEPVSSDISATTTSRDRIVAPKRPSGAHRILLPASAAVAGTLVAASRILQVDAYSGMFGTDSNTEPHIQGMPTDFYIGKLGEGTTDSSHHQPIPGYFNTDSAAATSHYRTTGFWYTYGPAARGSLSPYNYGFKQGSLAISSWNNNTYCCMENIFADVEDNSWIPGSGHTSTDNANCLNGFLDAVGTTLALSCYRPTSLLIPGVYFNKNQSGHSSWFPAGYSPSRPFVFWGAGAYSVGACSMSCSPCNSQCSSTLTEVTGDWNAGGVYHACFAGQGIALWQFWISNCGCGGDWDYSGYTTPTNPSDGAPHWGAVTCH